MPSLTQKIRIPDIPDIRTIMPCSISTIVSIFSISNFFLVEPKTTTVTMVNILMVVEKSRDYGTIIPCSISTTVTIFSLSN